MCWSFAVDKVLHPLIFLRMTWPSHSKKRILLPLDPYKYPRQPQRNQWLWMALRRACVLLLLLLFFLHSCSFFLHRANLFGRKCLPSLGGFQQQLVEGQMGVGFAMVSFSDEGAGNGRSFYGLMDVVRSEKENYARRWGYDFIDARNSLDQSRPAGWSKIPAVRAHLGRYHWIFWNDADSLLMNPNISLEKILSSLIGHLDFKSSPDLIVTEDINGVNSGMFFIRRSSWSESFLDTWWNQTSFVHFKSTKCGDNAAMAYLIKSLKPEEMRVHILLSPMQCVFNSYPWFPTLKSTYRLIKFPRASWKGAYSYGDFMVHLAGLDDKKGWAAKMLEEMEVSTSFD